MTNEGWPKKEPIRAFSKEEVQMYNNNKNKTINKSSPCLAIKEMQSKPC
jgi:hypothetical protein